MVYGDAPDFETAIATLKALAEPLNVSEATIWRLETADGPLGGKPETHKS